MPKNKHNAAAALLKIKQRDQFLAEVVDLRKSFLETISCNPLHSQGRVEEGLLFVSRKARIAHLISVYLCEIVDVLEQENSPNGDFWLVIALAVLAERAERKPDQHLTTEVYDKILKVTSKFVKVFDAAAFTGLGQFTESPAFSRDERLAYLRAAATYFGVLAYFFDDGKQEAASGKEHFGLQLREHPLGPEPMLEAAEEAPWYPDDSGEWVEVSGKGYPKGLKKKTRIQYLLRFNREAKQVNVTAVCQAGELNWKGVTPGDIVAYKVLPPSSVPAATPTPWYPDESRNWVEINPESIGKPKGLKKRTLIHYLVKADRDAQTYSSRVECAGDLIWHTTKDKPYSIVAYKIADPVAVDALWYPDESGEWVEVTSKGRPKGLKKSTLVQYLHLGERKNKDFIEVTDKAGDLDWRRASQGHPEHSFIVAYRIVKKD